jgi:hypothetical protein
VWNSTEPTGGGVNGECFGWKLVGGGILVNPPARSDRREREGEEGEKK